ncbi:methionyl-tRNA formyltransferase [Flavobacteriaceae bacterium Ap0902]|nr:methionyl-tRNA formyltransferase [Flavobacteriaceae bacterium Ap0902]
MNSELRILFMGTPDFAVHILDYIIKHQYNVVGVVSVPDKPAGRGQKIHSSAVAKYAKKNQLNLLQPEKLKSKAFIQEIKDLDIDVSVVVAFRMLPREVWKLPKLGTFNLHASLLPQYRGAAPINHAIMNGETESGVTTFLIDEQIDTGNILLQESVKIESTDNAGDLHDKLMETGAKLVIKTLEGLEHKTLIPKPQKEAKDIKYATKIFKEDCAIPWDKSLLDIYNFIRGLSPYPVAWTHLYNKGKNRVLKVYKASIEKKNQDLKPGQIIIKDKKMGVAHKDGIIWLEEIQLEGKRRMSALDFLNGNNLSEHAEIRYIKTTV